MKKSLLTTNPYLKDAALRERSMTRNIESSSAVEGIRVKRDSVSGHFVQKDDSKASSKTVNKTSR